METLRSILAVFAGSVLAVACGASPSADAVAASANVKVPASPWTFTKTPAAFANYSIAAPAPAFAVLNFEMTSRGSKDFAVTQMAFMITGTVQVGDLANFQLVYFADGLKKPGVVVGTNDGSTWTPGATTSIVPIDLATPIVLNQNFKGDFALNVDVNGTAKFFFSPQLSTVTIDVAGVPQLLVGGTCDLPLPGDQFNVN
ncbi:MAG: hypothetical protein ACM3PC_09945 [Deltaproteobacteria bacterium]